MNRRQARERAFVLAYEMLMQTDKEVDALINETSEMQEFTPDEYIVRTVRGISEKKEEIDVIISGSSKGWKLERLSRVSLAIMRLAVYEMLWDEGIPFSVSINEAVELAKRYDDEKAPKFINGILNDIADKKGLKGGKEEGR